MSLTGPLPPLVEPEGPRRRDVALVRDFVEGEPAESSPSFHIEGSVLVAGSGVTLAVRIGERSVLVRRDVPDEALQLRLLAEGFLAGLGLTLFDEDTPLGLPVGIQAAGLRMAVWDLWGAQIDQAFACLRRAVLDPDPPFPSGAEPGSPLDE